MQGKAEPECQQHELAGFDTASQGDAAQDQEDHRLERPDLRHLEIRREPLDDQPLLLGAAAGLKRIQIDVPSVRVHDRDRDRGKQDGAHRAKPGEGHRARAAQYVAQAFDGERQADDGVREDEAGMQIDPQEHDRGQGIKGAAVTLAIASDPQIRERAQGEGDHLDPWSPDRVGRCDAQRQGQTADDKARPPIDREIDEEKAGGGHGPQREADQGQPSDGIEDADQHLAEPLVGDPAMTGNREGKEVLMRNGVMAQDPIAGG